MTVPLFVHPAASLEISSARSWYEDISTELGNDFASAIAEAIELILSNPLIYADIGDGFHRAIIRRFPYQVFYRIGGSQISVLAVQHSHADRQALLEQATRREAKQ